MATAIDGYAGQGHYSKPTAHLLETIGIELFDKDGELLPAYSYLRANKQKTGLTPVDWPDEETHLTWEWIEENGWTMKEARGVAFFESLLVNPDTPTTLMDDLQFYVTATAENDLCRAFGILAGIYSQLKRTDELRANWLARSTYRCLQNAGGSRDDLVEHPYIRNGSTIYRPTRRTQLWCDNTQDLPAFRWCNHYSFDLRDKVQAAKNADRRVTDPDDAQWGIGWMFGMTGGIYPNTRNLYANQQQFKRDVPLYTSHS